MQLSKIGEFGLIRRLQKKCTSLSPGVLTGIGDDAGVLKITKKTLITTDMMIEGVHFDLSFTTFYQLGYKFLAINISDIFAMGGTPLHFLASLGIPAHIRVDEINELYSGMMKIAKKFGVTIIGGDTCVSKCGLLLSGTLVGHTGRAIMRSGAKVGDAIFVSDTLGDSAMGLHLLRQRGKRVHKFTPASPRLKLMKRHLMPRLAALKDTSKITSMIDISDGLLMDLSHICDESNVGAIIYEDKIPVSKELKAAVKGLKMDPIELALHGGEDYALLYTASPDCITGGYKIGEIIKKGRFLVDSKGNKTTFKPEGYEHFR